MNAPSLNTGWENRLVVAVVTTRPVSASALRNRSRILWRSASSLPKGTTSLSWKLMPYAPISASFSTARTGSISGRVGSPNGSRPGYCTVHRPKENLSPGEGT